MAIGLSSLAGAGAGGNLGTLFVVLTANSTGLVAGMKQAQVAVATNSASMLAATKTLAKGVTGALAAIGAVSVIQWAKFDQAMTRSLAIMGDVSESMRDEMERTARTLAVETTTSATKAAEAYFFLASAGLSAEQSVAALATVNQFAIAGAFDMATATDLLTDAQSALGLTVEDTTENMINMTRVSDVLVKANTLANATVEQFSESLTREAGAALKSFNIDVEEGVAVLAAFADQGVKGQIAGTSLSRILRLMTSAAVKNASAYRDMGVSVFDASGNIRNMADIVQNLEEVLGDLSDEQRVAALETLGFQARVQGVILPLMGTSDAIREYERELRNAGGTTDDVANKQMKSFASQMKILWNQITDVFLTIGEQLAPVLQALNQVLFQSEGATTGLGDAFRWIISSIGPALVKVIGIIGDAFWGLKLIFQALKIAMLELVKIILVQLAKVIDPIAAKINAMIDAVNRLPGVELPRLMGVDGKSLNELANGLEEVKAETIQQFDRMLAEGRFSERFAAEYEAIINPIEKTTKQVEEVVAASTEKMVSDIERVSASVAVEDINRLYNQAFGEGGAPIRLAAPQVGDPNMFQMQAFREQQAAAEENLEILRTISEQEVELTADAQEKKLALMEAYNEQVKALQMAQMEIILGSSQQMFGDLATITKGFVGEQSAIYKGMFALSKAFAIADATVKIAQGVAAAAALPFPANIPAMASVVAATASIISSIQAVQLEFGGARREGGPVNPNQAFLVGEAGPEIFTPSSNGTIIPNDQIGGGNVKVVINNFTDAEAQVRETQNGNERQIEVMIKRVKNEIASEIKEGRGDVTRSIQGSFGLSRRGAT